MQLARQLPQHAQQQRHAPRVAAAAASTAARLSLSRPLRSPAQNRMRVGPVRCDVAAKYQPDGKAAEQLPALDVKVCGTDEGCLIEHWIEAYEARGNSKRKLVVGGNWKCNGTQASVSELVSGLNKAVKDSPEFFDKVEVIVAPPLLHLAAVKTSLNPKIKVAAQNCHFGGTGAFTGEVAADQLVDLGIEWVILGHSERRATPESGYGLMGNESNELVAKKVKYAVSKGLNVMACIGETLDQREAGSTLDVCKAQLKAIADVLTVEEWSKIVIAYEPVWAIGTGKSATKEDAQAVHAGIRGFLAVAVSPDVAANTRIQYGGSVSPDNCSDLGAQPDIDGFLVGGASLKAVSFKDIVVEPVTLYPNKFAV